MDKIKNILHPGRTKGEDNLYGSGQAASSTGAVTGEGSHLTSDTGGSPGLGGSQTVGTTATAGLNATSTDNPSGSSGDQSRRAVSSGSTSGFAGQGSHLAGVSSGPKSGLTGSQTEVLGHTSQKDAVFGTSPSGIGSASTSTTTGPSPLAKDAATTAAATIPGDTGFGNQNARSGTGGLRNPQSRKSENLTSTTGSDMPGAWDDSYDQSRSNSYIGSSKSTGLDSSTGGSAYPGTSQGSTSLDHTSGTSGASSAPQGASSEYPTQGTSTFHSTTGSTISRSTAPSSGHLGRDIAALGPAGGVAEGSHHHGDDQPLHPSLNPTGYPGATHDSRGNTSSITTGAGHPLSDDDVADSSGLGTATVLGTTISHSTTLPSGSSVPSSAAVTENPHYSAGLTDRTVEAPPNSSIGYTSQPPTSTTGYTSQQPNSAPGYSSQQPEVTSSRKHLGRDAALVGGAGVLGGAALHHHQDQENLRSQYTDSSNTYPGVGNEYSGASRELPLVPKSVHAPTASSVGNGNSSVPAIQTNTDGAALTGNTSDHHYGRDATALGVAGAIGEGIHRERAAGSGHAASGPQGHDSSIGPHATDTANMLDPNVKGGAGHLEDAIHHDPHHGGGAEEADEHHSPTITSSKDQHFGRDAAVGAGGIGAAGLLAHEKDKHATGNTSGSVDRHHSPTAAGSHDHHFGRDAAVGSAGVGAAGLTLHEKEKHATEHTSSAAYPSTASSSTANPTHKSGHSAATTLEPKDVYPTESTTSESKTYSSTTSSGDHHYGRDVAIGAGGVSAAGLAKHEYDKHQSDNTTGSIASSGSSLPGPAPNTAGPHSKDWMNRLDPRVDTNPTATREDTQAQSVKPGSQASPGAIGHETKSASSGKDLYYGRDAALGAGGVDAASHARREYEKHRAENTSGIGSTTGSSQPAPERYGAGTNTTEYASQQPTSTAIRTQQQPGSSSENHHGRDAAVLGGIGAAGYEAEKHLGKNNNLGETARPVPSDSAGTATTPRRHHNDMFGMSSKTSPNVEIQHHTTGYEGPSTTRQPNSHHHAKEAAIASGVGGAAYEAEHNKHDKDLTQTERDAKKQHKHDEKEAKKEHKHEEAHKEKRGGLLGFLRRDKNKKYTAEEEVEFDREEHEHNTSHTGRDVALGTAGAGALGVGAYKAADHHNDKTPLSTDKYATGNQSHDHGVAFQNPVTHDSTTGQQSGHHYERDAAVGAGAAGATGHNAHEQRTHPGATPLAEKAIGSDLGDKLHGPERNRGVPGSSGFPGSEGYGTGAVTGAPGLGSHVPSEASTDQSGNLIGSGGNARTDNTYVPEGYGSEPQGQQYLGRDATLGAGAASAVGVGTYEHRKHDSGYQNTLSPTSQQFDSKIAGTSKVAGSQQHDGRGDGTVGGVGAHNQGEDQYRKHDNTSDLHSGLSSDNYNKGAEYGQQHSGGAYPGIDESTDPLNDRRVGPNIAVGEDGRKRLHKDPPANHPAA